MNTNYYKKWLVGMMSITSILGGAAAADITWGGGGTDADWSTDANWIGGAAPTGSTNVLHFDGAQNLASHNNSHLSSVTGIVFEKDAGAFDLKGTALSLGGNIINRSMSTQTITLDLVLTSNREIDTGFGNIVVKGNISQNLTPGVTKLGWGDLTFAGANSYTGRTQIYSGQLILDATTGSTGSSEILFGKVGDAKFGNNATYKVTGASHTQGGAVVIASGGASRLVVDGIALTLASLAAPTTSNMGTLNVDLSKAGSSLSVTTAPALSNGRLSFTTVTDGVKTGFATWNGTNVVRLDASTSAALPTSAAVSTQNYRTSGDVTLTASQAVSSLTVTDSGLLSGSGLALTTIKELLMEEEAGDYEVSLARIGHNTNLAFHLYSTDGALIVNSQILLSDTGNAFSKAGPGILRLTASSISSYTGLTRLQSGRTELDGSLTRTSEVLVYRDALLAGGGTIGGSIVNAVPASSIVKIKSGKLEATTSKALSITGDLLFEKDSEFVMLLDGAGSDFVDVKGLLSFSDGVNLKLSLGAVPVIESEINLFRADQTEGWFATVNGVAMGEDDWFTLSYNSEEYAFQLYQNNEFIGVRVGAIPEPTLMALSGIGAALLLVSRKRRNVLN